MFSTIQHSENKELSKAVSGITWEMKTKHDLEEKAGAVSGEYQR